MLRPGPQRQTDMTIAQRQGKILAVAPGTRELCIRRHVDGMFAAAGAAAGESK